MNKKGFDFGIGLVILLFIVIYLVTQLFIGPSIADYVVMLKINRLCEPLNPNVEVYDVMNAATIDDYDTRETYDVCYYCPKGTSEIHYCSGHGEIKVRVP